MPALFQHAPQSLCLLRLSAIGDVCHAVAMVQAIQRQWPSTQITWVIGKVEAPLIAPLPGIRLVVFDKKAGLKGMRSVWAALKGQHFDALIHMQLALRASVLSMGIKAKYRLGFNRERAKEGQWLFTNRKIEDTESKHVVDSFMAFAKALGVSDTNPQWQMPISDEEQAFAKSKLGTQPTLLIAPAASKDERNWLPERYAQVADFAHQQGLQIAICGGPSEREKALAQQIISAMQYDALNLVGQTSLRQLLALIAQAHVVLAPDSGPAHMATTQGTPVIGLYGHSNPKRTGPYSAQQWLVSVYAQHVEAQHQKPLEALPWSTRVKGAHIMQDISVDAVTEKLSDILNIHPIHPTHA
ncbi:Lipopolysaccharide heptosyltransferase 1 [Vibrio stylophorae]|uniref:Lipopolysaccharide heptosyltransferase 1 n=1 Tax=Vibrio stylophorae TaxID=659351 RepID=A0ABN8DUH1_9VIBR|nr:glycosyltransferase family 9 protein [Vibrio stylophorae]CAH0534681.1 Lipopolysaccharide heptosyltransferase 1 [Vibrio stylophorae]